MGERWCVANVSGHRAEQIETFNIVGLLRYIRQIIMHSTLAQPQAASNDSLDLQRHVDEFLERGFTVIPNILTPEQIDLGKQLLTDLFEREKAVAQMHGWRNATYQCCYMLPGKHEFFRKLPLN